MIGNIEILLSDLIQTLAISKIAAPPGMTEKLNRLCHNFLWGKRDRIKRNSLSLPIDRGCINMINIEAYFEGLKAHGLTEY